MKFNLFEIAKRLPKPKLIDMMGIPLETDEDAKILASYIVRNYSPKEIDEAVKDYMKTLMPLENNLFEDLPFINIGEDLPSTNYFRKQEQRK